MALPPDLKDLLGEFDAAEVRYLVIGGYAVSFHSAPRFTKDLDLWVEDSAENLERAEHALAKFGAPDAAVVSLRSARGLDVVWMGNPPLRIDLMKQIPGGDFSSAWQRRVTTRWDDVPVSVIGIEDLLAAKRASGREQDRIDADALERARKQQTP